MNTYLHFKKSNTQAIAVLGSYIKHARAMILLVPNPNLTTEVESIMTIKYSIFYINLRLF